MLWGGGSHKEHGKNFFLLNQPSTASASRKLGSCVTPSANDVLHPVLSLMILVEVRGGELPSSSTGSATWLSAVFPAASASSPEGAAPHPNIGTRLLSCSF